jgi:hypothetical protein
MFHAPPLLAGDLSELSGKNFNHALYGSKKDE